MTILVAVKKNGRVFLGADRITTFGNEYHTDLVGGQKIMKLKNAYLATSGYTLVDTGKDTDAGISNNLSVAEYPQYAAKGASGGYKALGKGLRRLPKRKTPGSLLPLMANGKRSTPAAKSKAGKITKRRAH